MATNLQVSVGHNFEPGDGPIFDRYPVGTHQLRETSRDTARDPASVPVGRPCSTPDAPEGVDEPSGSGRSPEAALAAVGAQAVHLWGPWFLLAFAGTRECLEQRVCHVYGLDESWTVTVLDVKPRRSTAPAGVGIVAVAPVHQLQVAPR